MNSRLTALRDDIFTVDENIVRMLVKRTEIAIGISKEKAKLGLPVKDPVREEQVINAITSLPHEPMHTEDLERIYRLIIDLSREAQMRAR